jgi:hypothetical protein
MIADAGAYVFRYEFDALITVADPVRPASGGTRHTPDPKPGCLVAPG